MPSFFSSDLFIALREKRFSDFFQLRNFNSVANLKFKCLAEHVYLKFLFDKNRYVEIEWDRVFHSISILRRSGKFFHSLLKL